MISQFLTFSKIHSVNHLPILSGSLPQLPRSLTASWILTSFLQKFHNFCNLPILTERLTSKFLKEFALLGLAWKSLRDFNKTDQSIQVFNRSQFRIFIQTLIDLSSEGKQNLSNEIPQVFLRYLTKHRCYVIYRFNPKDTKNFFFDFRQFPFQKGLLFHVESPVRISYPLLVGFLVQKSLEDVISMVSLIMKISETRGDE